MKCRSFAPKSKAQPDYAQPHWNVLGLGGHVLKCLNLRQIMTAALCAGFDIGTRRALFADMASPPTSEIPIHVKETVASIAELHQRAHDDLNRHQRGVERLTAGIGRPRTLYAIVVSVMAWVGLNLWMMSIGHAPFDPPPFQGLQGVITLSALLVATMVLTTQNRQHEGDARRSRLALHMNMLTEAEVTKLIALLEELRRDLPNVRNRRDAQAEEMLKPVDPRQVVTEMDKKLDVEGDAGM